MQFNRVVLTVPPHVRFAISEVKDPEVTDSKAYNEIILAGLKKMHPEAYKSLKENWKEHVKGCIDAGESSDFYLLPRHMRSAD